MVLYEVRVSAAVQIRGAFERYMREKHVPEVLATGCFAGARFAAAEPGLYRTTYVAPTQDALDRYLADHAQRLREDFAAHFPAGVTVTREVWSVIEEWPPSI